MNRDKTDWRVYATLRLDEFCDTPPPRELLDEIFERANEGFMHKDLVETAFVPASYIEDQYVLRSLIEDEYISVSEVRRRFLDRAYVDSHFIRLEEYNRLNDEKQRIEIDAAGLLKTLEKL